MFLQNLSKLWKRWILKNPLLHMIFFASDFKVFQWDFFSTIYLSTTYLQKSVFLLCGTHIGYSIFIFIKGITFQLLLFLRWKVKEKLVLDFGLHLPLDFINLVNMYYYSIKLFNYFLYICYLLALCFRRRQSETFLLPNCFYSRELDRILFLANIPLI